MATAARHLALVPLAVALNATAAFVVNQLGLPLYLDTLGTMLLAVLVGPAAGITAGVLSQAVAGLQLGAYMLAFAPLQALVALLAAGVADRRGFASVPRSVLWGAAVGLVAGLASAGISYAAFKGVTATGVTGVTALLRATGLPLPVAVTLASSSTDVVDKVVVACLVGWLLRGLPTRLRARFPRASRAVGRA